MVEAGSFSAAAREMGVSKSHISKHVRDLENRLGVDLLHRTTRQLQLTRHGTDFYHRCHQILQNLDDAEAAVTDQITELRGEIRLTVAGVFGEDFICPKVLAFVKDYPDVSVDMVFTNRRVNIAEEHFDLAIRSALEEDSSQHSEPVHRYRLLTVASPGYLKAHGMPKIPADLKDHNCLMGTLPHWRFRNGEGVDEIFLKGSWRSNNGRALVQAAKQGLGIIQIPDFYLNEDIESRAGLVPVLQEYAVGNMTFWAVYPRRQYLPRRVQVLITYLKQVADFSVLKAVI